MGSIGEATAQRLEAGMGKLIATVEGLDEATLHRMPGEGEWSAMETLAHVAEMTSFWARRACQVADGTFGDRPYNRSPEEYSLRKAAIADHGADSSPAMLGWLRSSATESADLLRAIPDEGWARTAPYESEKGRQTVSQIVELRILSHLQAHIEQAAHAAAQAGAAVQGT